MVEFRTKGVRQPARVALVPTMGALHEGHLALVKAAHGIAQHVIVSIFVNPMQFGPQEDYSRYPRVVDHDIALLSSFPHTVVFTPSAEDMYPEGPSWTVISVPGMTGTLCGLKRPGHFDGVCTVVAKLFALAGRCRAYFGEKDYQQLAVVRRLASDLSFPVEVVSCPIVREPDGLALSSRNVRLGPDERQAATALWRGLEAGARALAKGERRPESVAAAVSDEVEREPLAQLEYAALVRADDLEPAATVDGGPLRLLVAARVGSVRLIDNVDPQDEDLVRCCRLHDDGASHERPVATGPQGKGGV